MGSGRAGCRSRVQKWGAEVGFSRVQKWGAEVQGAEIGCRSVGCRRGRCSVLQHLPEQSKGSIHLASCQRQLAPGNDD